VLKVIVIVLETSLLVALGYGLSWVNQLVGWDGLGQRKWTHGQLVILMYLMQRSTSRCENMSQLNNHLPT